MTHFERDLRGMGNRLLADIKKKYPSNCKATLACFMTQIFCGLDWKYRHPDNKDLLGPRLEDQGKDRAFEGGYAYATKGFASMAEAKRHWKIKKEQA